MKFKLALTLTPFFLSGQVFAENKESLELFGMVSHEVAAELNRKATIDVVSRNGKKHRVYLETLYQDDNDGVAYDNYGNTYALKGTYEVPDKYGNLVERSCTKAKLFLDPMVVPVVASEDLPGPSCYIESSALDTDQNNNFIAEDDEFESLFGGKQSHKTFGCKRFAAYAPPLMWSPEISVASHIGSTRYTVKTKVMGNTQVQSKAKYYNGGWVNRYFYNSSISFTTGNAAASVFMSYIGKPLGSSIQGTIC